MTMAHLRASRRDRPEALERAPGYAPNGEGEWTRHKAGFTQHSQMRTSARPPDLRGRRTLQQQIAEQDWKLRNLRAELMLEDNPVRREKLAKNIEIKRNFLAALRGEL